MIRQLLYRLSSVFLAVGILSFPGHAYADKILNVQTIKSKGGIEAWLVEDKTVPVISISFSFAGGLALDPEDKPGVGRLVSILLDEGAGDIKSQEFQKQLSDKSITVEFTSGRDDFYGGLKTLSASKDEAFHLLNLALTAPRFDQDAITRMKNANTAEIRNNLGKPDWLVERVFNGMLFEGHPYARPGFGHLLAMSSITRDDLVHFVKTQFAKDVLKVAIVGDISKEDAAAALDAVFGSLPLHTDIEPTAEAKVNYGGKTILLPLDAPQTFISVGQKAIKKTDKDWQTAVVMSEVLGGAGFNSRLMQEIREKRGLTYGIYSTLMNLKGVSVIQAGFSASNDKVKEALQILKTQWDLLAENGPTEEELEHAKSYLTGSLLLNLTSTSDISEALNGLQRDGLGPDYINQRNDLIQAVSVQDVQRVARQVLKSKELTTIMVGKPAGINVDILLDHPPGMPDKKEEE